MDGWNSRALNRMENTFARIGIRSRATTPPIAAPHWLLLRPHGAAVRRSLQAKEAGGGGGR